MRNLICGISNCYNSHCARGKDQLIKDYVNSAKCFATGTSTSFYCVGFSFQSLKILAIIVATHTFSSVSQFLMIIVFLFDKVGTILAQLQGG